MKKIQKNDIVFLITIGFFSFFYPIPRTDLSFQETASLRILDRNGSLLRESLSAQQGKGHWIGLDAISPCAVEAAIAAEDKRFYSHFGVDLLALTRAAWQNISSGEVVSGGSTITQQVIRNLYHFPRNIFFKSIELWYAVRLENTLSKPDILEQYFNRIPFGNQTFGIEAAARLYLGKNAKELTWSEAAFLMALPKSPTNYNPYKDPSSSEKRRSFILKRLRDADRITSVEWERANREPVILFPPASPFFAPHFCDRVLQNEQDRSGSLTTSIDLALQLDVEKIIRGHVNQLQTENVTNSAAIVIHNKTGDILALAGSSNYFDERHDGQFNAVFSKRQPGSALKPFTFAAAMKKNLTAASIIADMEISIPSKKATFTPRNYDNLFHGPVRARTALACSYNVSAVRVLQSIGVESLLSTLRACGIESLTEPPEYYGHGLTLGNGEVTLFELTRAYSILANGGKRIEPRFVTDIPSAPVEEDIISPQICFLISSILSDNSARAPAFGFDSPLELPFPCAVKTGTSSDFRDNMTVGFTSDYTVGVWVGNFDNTPMKEISGVTGAGPIFHDIMMRLHSSSNPSGFARPPKISSALICSFSGALRHAGCESVIEEYFLDGTTPRERCAFHRNDGTFNIAALMPEYEPWLKNLQQNRPSKPAATDPGSETVTFKIIQPRDKAVYKLDPNLRASYQSIYFEVTAPPGLEEIRWFINGSSYRTGNKILWNLLPGSYQLTVEGLIYGKMQRDELRFEVIP
jgi:penicillin-binding protein 1C